jgi:hypothetical protein
MIFIVLFLHCITVSFSLSYCPSHSLIKNSSENYSNNNNSNYKLNNNNNNHIINSYKNISQLLSHITVDYYFLITMIITMIIIIIIIINSNINSTIIKTTNKESNMYIYNIFMISVVWLVNG